MTTTHGTPPRGLDATRSPLFEGRFGRMFRNLRPAEFGKTDAENRTNLRALGAAMSATAELPTDGLDPEESGVPALYTYFGQFVDHDITFDPVSTLTRALDPDGLTDYRTPGLNLDNVYGRGPDDQPYMYTDKGRFQLGEPITGLGGHPGRDLPRLGGRAIIGDPRNDENSLVSQLQGLMLQVHSRMADDNGDLTFDQVQQLVRFHYQYVVANDFLPRIVSAPVLEALRTGGRYDAAKLRFFHWRDLPFMPVEFSVAAYRLGHSMIRPGYRLNDEKILPIFPAKNTPDAEALTGFQPMRPGHALDWGRFIDLDIRPGGSDPEKKDPDSQRRLQFAYRIDTSLVGFLHDLPSSVAGDPPPSLGERNLLRGWLLGLPSGQDVARAMGIKVIDDKDIIIGKAVDQVAAGDQVGAIGDAVKLNGGDPAAFVGNCPLWTYILAEAARHRTKVALPVKDGGDGPRWTPQLGPVGGRIVAEVFLGLLFGDGLSWLSLDPLWTPVKPDFRLKDLVSYGLGEGPALHYR